MILQVLFIKVLKKYFILTALIIFIMYTIIIYNVYSHEINCSDNYFFISNFLSLFDLEKCFFKRFLYISGKKLYMDIFYI